MSFHYPRRIKDLPTRESDSEDDIITPRKGNRQYEKPNKENVDVNTTGCHGSRYTSYNLRIPKRSSELPTLESDSEEDEANSLNQAILNASFRLSPSRSDDSFFLKNALEESEKKLPLNQRNENLSLVDNFNDLELNEKIKESTQKPRLNDGGHSNQQLQPSHGDHNIKHATFAQEISQPQYLLHIDTETPFKAQAPFSTSTTITTKGEPQFVTPQVRTITGRSHQQSRNFNSTQTQKQRLNAVNDCRSQKVLFQTPMSVSRLPPLPSLSNDTLALALCDTITETGNTPSTADKSPKEKEPGLSQKSKKSLEKDFVNAGSTAGKTDAPVSVVPSTSNGITSTAKQGPEDILRINNVDYLCLERLGSGGSSVVYAARQLDNGMECALKVVDLRADPATVAGYINETRLLHKLQGNLCVVALYNYQVLEKEAKLLMVMERGTSDLQKILQNYTSNNHLPLYMLMNFLYQMLQAVNYIHQNGVIHSDLKPANFLLVSGRLKLIDFGIASNISIDSTSIIKYSQVGTFNYISPEALTDTSTGTSPMRSKQPKIKISTKSDVWSLGCILYLFIYKKTPFNHIKNIYAKISTITNPAHVIEYPPPPSFYPNMLLEIVKSCLQHNPKKRPSCEELLKYPFNMIIPIHNLQSTK